MSRKAKPANSTQTTAPRPDDLGPAGMSADWMTRLADLVLGPLGAGNAEEKLQSLWAGHATGDAAVDANRLTLLAYLGQRLAQMGKPSLIGQVSPLPDWPDADLSPLPQLHPAGLEGTSLITVCEMNAAQVLDQLPEWLAFDPQEVVIVEHAEKPILAAALLQRWPTPDTRIRLAEITSPDVTPTQAWNAGLRLCRYQRMICLTPGMDLPSALSERSGPPPGHFGLLAGPKDGCRFLLDLDRRDTALVGGFNEYLASMDFVLSDLCARLMAQGLVPWHPAQDPASLPPPRIAISGTLRDALSNHPALPALRNRHIAALMPDWQGSTARAFGFAGAAALGPRLEPAGEPVLPVPAVIAGTAEAQAQSDMVSAHLGVPVLLGHRRLDMVLSRPVSDVCAMDVAVAASHAPDGVRSRRAWLVIDIAPEAFPASDNLAHAAFEWLRLRAEALGSALVLRANDMVQHELSPLLSDLPQVPADPALTRDFWPATLSDLAQDSGVPLPHATLQFNLAFLDDHTRFIRRGPSIFLRRPKLFVDAQHGLGNRLRAMASAAAIAQATGRELIVIWQADAHCDCSFDQLFQPSCAVLSEGFAPEAVAMGMDLFNYMQVEPGSEKDRPVRLNATKDAYLRSAYPLVHPASTWTSENTTLRQFRPTDVVMDRVLSLGPQRPDLAVHIRMEGGKAAEHLAYESPANWTASAHLEIDHWRKRSHFSYFLPRIDQLLSEGLAERIFLATDTPAVYDCLATRYGARLSRLKRPATDRSAIAMVHALADAILLSRAPRLLGSTWSSFTELAARLADDPIELELSGRDF